MFAPYISLYLQRHTLYSAISIIYHMATTPIISFEHIRNQNQKSELQFIKLI